MFVVDPKNKLWIPIGFARQHENRFANYLNQMRLERILQMVITRTLIMRKNTDDVRVLDIGCGNGAFSRVLSQICQTVGVDVQKRIFRMACSKSSLNFLVGDINMLPFNGGSFNLIVCASILEHMVDLDCVLLKLREMLKINGVLIAGYPVETRLFKFVWHFASPREFKFIDQSQIVFVNPYNGKVEDYWKNPGTHKQTYLEIRKALEKHFKLIRKIRLPFDFFPDLLLYYEITELSCL
jgi:ubiquinone/menaquinone biosynthesis C-methylase UbiE